MFILRITGPYQCDPLIPNVRPYKVTKTQLLAVYRTALNTCKLAYASLILWSFEDTPAFFEQLYNQLDIPKPHDGLVQLIHDQVSMRIAVENLYDSTHRSALKELFEVTKLYFESTGQSELLKSQPWYQFWRILRNSLSHDTALRFSDYDLKRLPVSWSGVTIAASLEGKTLTHGLLSREKLRELLEAAALFIEERAA